MKISPMCFFDKNGKATIKAVRRSIREPLLSPPNTDTQWMVANELFVKEFGKYIQIRVPKHKLLTKEHKGQASN